MILSDHMIVTPSGLWLKDVMGDKQVFGVTERLRFHTNASFPPIEGSAYEGYNGGSQTGTN